MCVVVRPGRLARPAARFPTTAQSISARRSNRLRSWLPRSHPGEAKYSFLTQPISKPADSFNNVAGLAEFFAETPNVGIDRTGVDHTFVTPNLVQQTIAFLNASAALHQRAQKFEFKASQTDRFAVDEHLMPRGIDGDCSGGELLVGPIRRTATQNRFDSQNYFPGAEWFHHIIVRAKFQADDSVHFFSSGA